MDEKKCSELRERSFRNKGILKNADWCMCYHCVKRFKFDEIIEFVDEGRTAMCPKCGIDSVLDDIDRNTIVDMHDQSFNFGYKPTREPIGRFRKNKFKKNQEWDS